MIASEEDTKTQVERILQSEAFRSSPELRRLFRFLAEKSLSGEADELKEYTVAIDGLGKPDTYDPRQDSVVRIQVGRLRQKLAEYYRSEGKDDQIVIEVPKGHFRLNCEPRPRATEMVPPPPESKPEPRAEPMDWRKTAIAMGTALAVSVVCVVYLFLQLSLERRESAPFRASWTPELEELWRPFLSPKRPLIVYVAAPLFVGMQGFGLYRDLTLNRWEDVLASPKIAAIRQALGNPGILPRYYYAGSGEVSAAFHLGKLLATTNLSMSVAKSSQLSWQQLADNNVVAIGPARLFQEQLRALPADLEFLMDEEGIHNLHPKSGEASVFADQYPSILRNETPGVPDDGEVYSLITLRPGPLGNGEVQSFSSNHSPGTLAAVQWFTNPPMAKALVAKLRKPSGEIPRYYQLVLKVKYKDAVPTEISYVTHHELHPGKPNPAEK